ncbi:MAG TPA: multidrug efflux RND transporter permease subunit, partial [Thermoanaerobaculia bacterium]|nr:multidrug efflux RND transporter permease subunit [Thermoanaerobaculia bacterium]
MVDFFIRRPVFASVCAMILVLAGAISIPTLPVAQFPQLAPPQITVSSFYTGASAQAVETAVTTPLEQAINGVEGMRYLQSTSGNDGSSSIVATFDLSRNLDVAAVDIQNRVASAQGRLPNEVKTTGVTIAKNSSAFVMGLGLFSRHGEYDALWISNYADVFLKDAIKRVPGVGDVIIFGERKYAMRLWLDPERLAARKLTAQDVVSALQEQNVQVPAGQLGQPPAPAGQQFQISVRAVGRLVDPAQFDQIILKSAPDGTLVRLRDVGRAELGAESYGTNLRLNGIDAVGMGVLQLPTANALAVDKAVRIELARLARSFPPGLEYLIAFDPTTAVSESIREVLLTLLEAIALVILVIFLFLQDWRVTLIPAITIPVSLVGTFTFVKLLGFSINTLTLFGITLATGLVVDDAIVVIENIERHIRERNIAAPEAASSAMKEVAGAVIATSIVLVAVFVPVGFFPGTTGILYKQFALTIAFSVALSAFNALTLSPALAARLLGHEREHPTGIFGRINATIAATTRRYRDTLTRLVRRPRTMGAAFLAGLGLTYLVFRKVPTSFVPNEDQGYFIVAVQSPPGASLDYTNAVGAQVTQTLMREKEIAGVFAVGGFSFSGTASNKALVFAPMKPLSERRGAAHSVDAVIGRVRGALMGIPGAIVVPFPPPPIAGVGNFGGFQFEVQDQSGGAIERLAAATQDLVGRGNRDPALRGLFTDFTSSDPQLLVTIDREKAKVAGVDLAQITAALQVYMGSVYVNDFDFNNRAYRVTVQADRRFRSQPRDLRAYEVRSSSGKMIPLETLIDVRETTSPQVISHYNLFRSAEINGSAAPGYSSGQALAEMESLARRVLPAGIGYSWSGLSLEELQSGGKSIVLFGLGILFVYLTLAAQYESFALPFTVLLAVPLAILGALLAQAIRGLQNDVYCQIGLVMLIGLASKNAILIVEFAEQLRAKGMTIAEAAVEAARIRLRPILMTSFAFLLGVLPLVFAKGAGRESRHSIGTTVFGGMIFATTLNLLFIPALYVIVETFRE